MTPQITKNKNSWITQNIELLLQYKGNWIAYNNQQGLIAFCPQLDDVMVKAEAITDDYTVWHVSKHFGQPRAFHLKMVEA